MAELLILIFSFFIFLYFLYFIGKDDFVIIRKDIPLEKIFSIAILAGLVGIFSARLTFIIFSSKFGYLNPIVFFALPYYPGLSLIGGVTGGSLFIYLYSLYKKIQVGRIFDLFIMSFSGILPISLFLNIIYMQGKESMIQNIMFIASIIILIIFSKFLFPYASKGEIKDGSLGLVFVLILSFIQFTFDLLLDIKNFSFFSVEHLFILSVFFISLILIINQEIMNKFLAKK